MLVSHKHKLVIFTPERTASTSIHFALKQYFDVVIDDDSLNINLKHIPAETFDKIIKPFLTDEYYKIAVFREPIARTISLYTVSNSKETFSNWWKLHSNDPWVSQKHHLSVNNLLYIDRLFSFDRLDLFCNFLTSIFNNQIKLPNFGMTDKSNIEVSKFMLDNISSCLSDDINIYKSITAAGSELIINPYQPTP
jgi:hypothetical protein